MATLNARVQQLEARLDRFTGRPRSPDNQSEAQTTSRASGLTPIVMLPMTVMPERRNAGFDDGRPKSLDLPPLDQVLPLVHVFLEKFNSVLPLFHPQTILRVIHECYNLDPQHRDPVAWSAVHVVLALAYRHCPLGKTNAAKSQEHLGKAHSVLPELALGDVQLLNVQVLVGMVMLIQGAQDLQPALILLATTMRLAHKIGLHSRAFSAHLCPTVARQRACVFWLAYILDKDLSLRAKQPSIQLDDDIDLDLPYPHLADYEAGGIPVLDNVSFTEGTIFTVDGAVKLDYFVTRIQLAVIEGGVYDYLYSTRSQKRSPEERSRALDSVSRALELWKTSVPQEFQGHEALRRAPSDMLWFLCSLDATSLLCTTSINQAHAWNAQWMTTLRRQGSKIAIPVQPPQWMSLVHQARNFMFLCRHLGIGDSWNFW